MGSKRGSTILAWMKRHGAAAGSWALMAAASAGIVLLAGPYLLPGAWEPLRSSDPESRGRVGGAPEEYGIQEIISAVRAELIATQDALVARKEGALFQLDTFDIELSFVVKRGSTVSAEARAPQFLVVGTDTEYKKEEVQRIQLHFRVDNPGPLRARMIESVPDPEEAVELE